MSIFTSGDSVNAIVADIGSYATKIGHAGEDYPRAYFRSVSWKVQPFFFKLEDAIFYIMCVLLCFILVKFHDIFIFFTYN